MEPVGIMEIAECNADIVTNRFVCISERVKNRIDFSAAMDITPFVFEDIAKEIENITHGLSGAAFALVFANRSEWDDIEKTLSDLRNERLYSTCVLVGSEDDIVDEADLGGILHYAASRINAREYDFLVKKGFAVLDEQHRAARDRAEYNALLLDMKQDQEDLINIGRSLSIEKDSDKLLRLILLLGKKITGADAGSIYIVEEKDDGAKHLRFKYSHTFSKNLPYEEFVLPIDANSIAGYVAMTGKVLNIPDVYELSDGDPVSFNSTFDSAHNYRSRSMLVVPMKNNVDEIIGVIQLINSKEDTSENSRIRGNEAFEITLATTEDFNVKVVPFAARYESLLEAVAGQAAIALENNRMMKQIQFQFEEFVRASVSAIESRDPATSGHSFRVAEICKQLAYAVNSETEGEYETVNFSETAIKELEYAALLHDFGKVYIDLAVFQKAKKLFPKELDNLMLKMDYLYRCTELEYNAKEIALLKKSRNGANVPALTGGLEAERKHLLDAIMDIKKELRALNEPTATDADPLKVLDGVISKLPAVSCLLPDGNAIDVISESERRNLEIRRGSLNSQERKIIESHVVHTYNFVSRIPWPPEFRNIPEIAAKHHEKLDGSGYPGRLHGENDIPIQARMMAIADIFDALSASDRPYKKSLPIEKTLAILQDEAKQRKLDQKLVDLFIRYRIYEKTDKNSLKGENTAT